MKVKYDAPGMVGQRGRNDNGLLRKKRGNTEVATIEKSYNVDFNVRGDMHLSTLLKRNGVSFLKQLLKKTQISQL